MQERKQKLQREINELVGDIEFLEQSAKDWIAKGIDRIPRAMDSYDDVGEFEEWLNVKSDLNNSLGYQYQIAMVLLPEQRRIAELEVYLKSITAKDVQPYPKSISMILNKIQFLKRKVITIAIREGFDINTVNSFPQKQESKKITKKEKWKQGDLIEISCIENDGLNQIIEIYYRNGSKKAVSKPMKKIVKYILKHRDSKLEFGEIQSNTKVNPKTTTNQLKKMTKYGIIHKWNGCYEMPSDVTKFKGKYGVSKR